MVTQMRNCIHCGKAIQGEAGACVGMSEGIAWHKGDDLFVHTKCQAEFEGEKVLKVLEGLCDP